MIVSLNRNINKLIIDPSLGITNIVNESGLKVIGLDSSSPKLTSLLRKIISNIASMKTRIVEWEYRNGGMHFLHLPNLAQYKPDETIYDKAVGVAAKQAGYSVEGKDALADGYTPQVNNGWSGCSESGIKQGTGAFTHFTEINELIYQAASNSYEGRNAVSGCLDTTMTPSQILERSYEFSHSYTTYPYFAGEGMQYWQMAYAFKDPVFIGGTIKPALKNLTVPAESVEQQGPPVLGNLIITQTWFYKASYRVITIFRLDRSSLLGVKTTQEFDILRNNNLIANQFVLKLKNASTSSRYGSEREKITELLKNIKVSEFTFDGRQATKSEILDNLNVDVTMCITDAKKRYTYMDSFNSLFSNSYNA